METQTCDLDVPSSKDVKTMIVILGLIYLKAFHSISLSMNLNTKEGWVFLSHENG